MVPQALGVVFFFFMIGVGGVRSTHPLILGRYSAAWFAVQLVIICAYIGLMAHVRVPTFGIDYVLVVFATFLVTSNESLRQKSPAMQVLLPLIRLLTALTIIAAEFDSFRAAPRARRLARERVRARGAVSARFEPLDVHRDHERLR